MPESSVRPVNRPVERHSGTWNAPDAGTTVGNVAKAGRDLKALQAAKVVVIVSHLPQFALCFSRFDFLECSVLRCKAHMRPEHNMTTSIEREGEPSSTQGHNRTTMRGDRNARAMTQIGASLAVPAIVEKSQGDGLPCGPSSSGVVDNQISVGGRIAATKDVINNGGAYKSGCFASSHLVQVMSHAANAKTTYNSATTAATLPIRNTPGRSGNLRPTHNIGTPMSPKIMAHGRVINSPRQTRSPAYSNVSSTQPQPPISV